MKQQNLARFFQKQRKPNPSDPEPVIFKLDPISSPPQRPETIHIDDAAPTPASPPLLPMCVPKDPIKRAQGLKYTPLESQYFEFKSKYKDTILFIECGYKYKIFDQDAVLASRILNIYLNQSGNLCYASIPTFRLYVHMQRLLNMNHKVGVISQLETAALKAASSTGRSKLFERGLTELYTKATFVSGYTQHESQFGHDSESQVGILYVSQPSFCRDADNAQSFPLCSVYINLHDGSQMVDSFTDTPLFSSLLTRLLHLNPAEIVFIENSLHIETVQYIKHFAEQHHTRLSIVDKNDLAAPKSKYRSRLLACAILKETSLHEQESYLNLLAYLDQYEVSEAVLGTLATSLSTLYRFSDLPAHMLLDGITVRNLDLTQPPIAITGANLKSSYLWGLLDLSLTRGGSLLIRKWLLRPLTSPAHIENRHQVIRLLYGHLSAADPLFKALRSSKNIDRLLMRIVYKRATPREVYHFFNVLGAILHQLQDLVAILKLDHIKDQPNEFIAWLCLINSDSPLFEKIRFLLSFLNPDHLSRTSALTTSSGDADLGDLSPPKPPIFVQKGSSKGAYFILNKKKKTKLSPPNEYELDFNKDSDSSFSSVASYTEDDLLEANNASQPQLNFTSTYSISPNIFANDYIPEAIQNIDKESKQIGIELEQYKLTLKEILYRISPVHYASIEYNCVSQEAFLVEVKNNHIARIPNDWLKISATKAVSRYRTPFIIDKLKKLNQLKETRAIEARKHWSNYLSLIAKEHMLFSSFINRVFELDAYFSIAGLLDRFSYSLPEFLEPVKFPPSNAVGPNGSMRLYASKHPILSQHLKESCVENDIFLDHRKFVILTGPNMGGKTCLMKQIALISIMAQAGFPISARPGSKLPIYDQILSRMGAYDDIQANKSTFHCELSEMSAILSKCTDRSLLLIDELGRGTSTYDGLAIAYGACRYLVESLLPTVLFSTHFSSLGNLARAYPERIVCKFMDYLLEEAGCDVSSRPGSHSKLTCVKSGAERVTFLYKLADGVSKKSYGLNVAHLTNIPPGLIETAQLKSLESEIHQTINGLDPLRRNLLVRLAERRLGQSSLAENSPLNLIQWLIGKHR